MRLSAALTRALPTADGTADSDGKATDKSSTHAIAPHDDLAHLPIWVHLNAYLDSLAYHNYSDRTIATYQLALVQFLQFLTQSHKPIDPLTCTRQMLTQFFGTRLEGDAISTVSAKLALSAIRSFYQYLITQNLTTHNPTTGFRLKPAPRKLPHVADEELMRRLLEQPMPDDAAKARLWVRDKAMFELMYSSGLRVSELVGLDVGDIDLDHGVVRVLGKGNKMRQAPVGSLAIRAIRDYLPHRDLWQEQSSSALFISERHGTRLSVRAVQLRLKACAASAGIDLNLHPHLLRHCFASHMLSASGDLRAVQEMLGHSNIATTQIYTQVDFGTLSRIYDNSHPRASMVKTVKKPQ